MNLEEFEGIRPYNDDEAVEALGRVASHPFLAIISKYLFPNKPLDFMAKSIRSVSSIDEFQSKVMVDIINAVLAKTSEGFSVSGTDKLRKDGKKFLAVSNHRDIVLDPALIQYTMKDNGLPFTQICVGNNLLSSKFIEDLMRSNRMIKVIRGISARELYLSSQILSKYIRLTIKEGIGSIWIAQREGRTKDGNDTTEQGLLKMFDMSGENGFMENFKELNIIPMSISYEYEPCDINKAREIYIKRTEGSYTKKKKEDLHSILTGIRQMKGHIHLTIGDPLTDEEIKQASEWKGNDRYQAIRHAVDRRVISGYRLWKTNYMAFDLMNGTSKYLGVKYLPEDLENFKSYTEHKLNKIEKRLDRDAVRDIFWHIYGNPVVSFLNITSCEECK